jgi:hypothetical protein
MTMVKKAGIAYETDSPNVKIVTEAGIEPSFVTLGPHINMSVCAALLHAIFKKDSVRPPVPLLSLPKPPPSLPKSGPGDPTLAPNPATPSPPPTEKKE